MKCFYHTDLDGQCAGAIVYWYHKNTDGREVECLPINYKDDFPFDKIQKDEVVYIVDFSLQKEGEFEKLIAITDNLVWIDHHKTAIEKHKHLEHKITGIREDGISGCELTWGFFYEDDCPQIVSMLGAYDIWNFSKYGNALNDLQCGIRLSDCIPSSPMWNELFRPNEEMLKDILWKGTIALQYRDNYYAGLIKSWSFWAEFEGYKAICCNAGSVSSQLFDDVKEEYDLMIPFVFDGKQWTVSLYTKKPEIDVSVIAKKYGGGGHKQASGFQCDRLPFSKAKV